MSDIEQTSCGAISNRPDRLPTEETCDVDRPMLPSPPAALSIRLVRLRRTSKHSSPEFCVANILNSGSPISGSVRVCFFVSFSKTPSTYMGVNLRRCQAFVAQQFLHTS